MYKAVDSATVRSVLNATIASAAAYGFGWLMRLI
jgi:hypothetical protein